jgi:hypothetical protein
MASGDFDLLCQCGHLLTGHTRERTGGWQPCLEHEGSSGCDCLRFRLARPCQRRAERPRRRA